LEAPAQETHGEDTWCLDTAILPLLCVFKVSSMSPCAQVTRVTHVTRVTGIHLHGPHRASSQRQAAWWENREVPVPWSLAVLRGHHKPVFQQCGAGLKLSPCPLLSLAVMLMEVTTEATTEATSTPLCASTCDQQEMSHSLWRSQRTALGALQLLPSLTPGTQASEWTQLCSNKTLSTRREVAGLPPGSVLTLLGSWLSASLSLPGHPGRSQL
jgi:hypothetical protein